MSRIAVGCWLAACAFFCSATTGFAQNNSPYMSSIPVQRASTEQAVSNEHAQMTLHVSRPELSVAALSDIDGVTIIHADQSTISIALAHAATIAGQPQEKYRQSTFVVDYDEPPVQSIAENLRSVLEQKPTQDDLQKYVYDHIADKTYSRTFDYASRVAESGAGDCTEHAVLLAALARASGYYARVVIGTLLLDTESEPQAFGHAWTEIHDGSDWRIRDATLPMEDSAGRNITYLPLGILDDEGPGYSISLIRSVSMMPSRISGLAIPD